MEAVKTMRRTIKNTLPAYIAALSMLILSGCFSDHPPLRCHEYGSGYFVNDSTIILLEVEMRKEYQEVSAFFSQYEPTGSSSIYSLFYSISKGKITSRIPIEKMKKIGSYFSSKMLENASLSNSYYVAEGNRESVLFNIDDKNYQIIEQVQIGHIPVFFDPGTANLYFSYKVYDLKSGGFVDSLPLIPSYKSLFFRYHTQNKAIAMSNHAFVLLEYVDSISSSSTKVTELEFQERYKTINIQMSYFDDLNKEIIINQIGESPKSLSYKIADLLEGKVLPDTIDYISGTITSQNSDKTSAVSATRGLTIFHKDKKPEIIFPEGETCHELE